MAKRKNKIYNLAKIKVIGIGGAGGNAVTRMSGDFVRGVDFVAINTDLQDLDHCVAKKKIYIGKELTRGLGTGMNPDLGRQAAEESQSEIAEVLKGADMIFLTAGLGGGTGTGGLPIVAEIAKDLGILTVAVITKPFSFEGYERARIAEEGVSRTVDKVDALIAISNDKIFSIINKNTSLLKAFEAIDEVLKNSVSGVAELIATPGIINVDFADVKSIVHNAGSAIIGIGVASGADRAVHAADLAIHSPLLEGTIDGAKRGLFSISGCRDLKMSEINDIARRVAEQVDSSARIIFGANRDRKLKKGELKVTLGAAGSNSNFIKNDVFTPNLFASENLESGQQKSKINLDKKERKEHKAEKEKVDSGKDDIWDIPAFLRRKKK